MTDRYGVIVVGARCAGSPTAMLLARKGYRMLMLDRATLPSDTIPLMALGAAEAECPVLYWSGGSKPPLRRRDFL